MTHEDVLRALSSVKDPELQRDVVDLGMVKDIVLDDQRIGATIVLTTAGCPLRNQIRADAEQALAQIAVNRLRRDPRRAKPPGLVHVWVASLGDQDDLLAPA